MISGAKQENLNGGEQRENQQWKWGAGGGATYNWQCGACSRRSPT